LEGDLHGLRGNFLRRSAALISGDGNGSSSIVPPQVPEPIINRCPECEQEIDVTELSPFAKTVCPHCHESIRVRTTLGVYHLTRLLGEGGMSQVFLATDTTLNREVALKVLHRSLTQNEGLAAMFEREAKLTASINHSNVVRVYTVGQDKGNFFIAMEVVDNVSLEEKISGQGMVPEGQVLEIAYDVALGLRAAFQAGLIHRDIKPGNILLTQDGAAKLVDFGLALAHGGEDEVDEVWATPFYVPPEKLDGEPDDFRGDIYSLGATLFHAVAGSPPFDANTASMQELKEIKAQPLQLKDAAPHASAKMAKLVDKMMSYKPAKRHQSYDELVGEIDALLEDSAGSGNRSGKRVGEHKRSKSAVSKFATIGIPVAVVVFGIVAYVVTSGNDGGDISTPILPGDGERVLGGGANAGQLFQQAREALVAGNFESAYSQFSGLLGSEDLKQPTRGWTRFNAALSLLLEGKEVEARSLFAELRDPQGFPEDGSEAETQKFFRKIGDVAGDPLPVMDDAHDKFTEDSLDCLGLLVCGLKNWNAGEFDSGARYLDRFLTSVPPENFSWVTSYQPLAKPFLEDLEIVKDLPRPERDLEAAQLAEMQKTLTLALDALQTNGAGRKMARSRLERVKRFLSEPPPKPPVTTVVTNSGANTPDGSGSNGNGGGGMDAKTVAEVEAFRQVVTEVSPMTVRYKFADAAARWDVVAAAYESATAKELSGLEREACRHAEEFVRGVTTWLAQGQYDDRVHGQVLRREGRPLDAKITAADRESVIVDLGFGPNRVPVEELAPAWLLNTYREHILTGAASSAESDPENWTRAVWFARQTGLKAEADAMAEQLAAYSEPFKNHWEMLETDAAVGTSPAGGASKSGSDASRGAFQQPGLMTPGGSSSGSKNLGGSIFEGDTTPKPE
jgi:serine/threonine protein kinase